MSWATLCLVAALLPGRHCPWQQPLSTLCLVAAWSALSLAAAGCFSIRWVYSNLYNLIALGEPWEKLLQCSLCCLVGFVPGSHRGALCAWWLPGRHCPWQLQPASVFVGFSATCIILLLSGSLGRSCYSAVLFVSCFAFICIGEQVDRRRNLFLFFVCSIGHRDEFIVVHRVGQCLVCRPESLAR